MSQAPGPGPGEWGWSGPAAALDWNYGANPAAKDYALQYAIESQRGLPHERAVLRAQMETKGFRDDLAKLVAQHGPAGVLMGRQILRDDRRFSLNPEPASAYNLAWAQTPLSSPLPERQSVPIDPRQLMLNLQGVTRSGGRFSSPYKAAAWPEGVLAAAQSGRAMDQPPAAAAAPAGQLPLDYQQLQQVIDEVKAAPPPAAPAADGTGWRRMAGRYGLPALAALGAFAGLAALTGMEQPRSQDMELVA